MADNVTIPATGTGTSMPVVATDDVAGVHYQKVRLDVGPEGSAGGPPAMGAGAVGATVPRTTLASDDPAVTALQILDDWDETDRAKVNPIAGQAGVQGASGVVTALTQRVVLATDVALPAGTNAIGKLAANSGVDIGDVDVTSVNSFPAHDAAIAGNPLRVAGRAITADYTAVATGDTADLIATILGKQIVKLDAVPDLSWSYAAAAGGLVNTTGVTAKAAAGAGVRNYVKSIQVINSHATISTEVLVRDGAAGTVLHRGWAQAAGGGYACTFDPPLRGSANTLVEIAEVTATASTGVLVSLQGYAAAE